MIDPLRPKLLLLVLIFSLTLQSCAGMKSGISSKKTSSQLKNTSQEPTQAVNLAQKHIEAGEYQKAIDIYSDECRKQPKDLPLAKEYAKSLEGIKSTADKELENGDFAAAGKMYYVLQNNYTKYHKVVQMLSFNSVYLNTKLSYCKKSLSMQGFQEYRQGNLNKAIMLWQSLLVIDPNNKDIKDTVRTAAQQQKNLQEKN